MSSSLVRRTVAAASAVVALSVGFTPLATAAPVDLQQQVKAQAERLETETRASWAEPRFSDVPDGAQFKHEIEWLASVGISTGYADGTFRPVQPVARDAMAAFLYRLAGSPNFTPPATSPFVDVSTDQQFYKEMAWLASKGISTGWPDGTFRPFDPVNRDAMAAFLYRSQGSPAYTPPSVSPFTDVSTSQQFYKEMAWLASTGISTGWPDGSFQPVSAVNRDAMAAFMYRTVTKFRTYEYSGSGPRIINLFNALGSRHWVADVTYSGSGNFIVEAWRDGDEYPSYPVNEVGSFQGTVSLSDSFLGGSPNTLMVTQANGPWTIKLRPVESGKFWQTGSRLTGNGDQVLPATGLSAPATYRFTQSTGSSNFIVVTHALDGSMEQVVVNEIGPSDGLYLMQPGFASIEVISDGAWSVAPEAARTFSTGTISGSGNSVIRPSGFGGAVTLHARHDGSSNFIVTAYNSAGDYVGLPVNVIGAYDNTMIVPAGTAYLEIQADGNWTLAR